LEGKLEEIKTFVEANHVRHVLFDEDLSPSQLRNLEKEFNTSGEELTVRVYDRSLLILDIFLMRAQTAQARTQVELAMNQYLLPRLHGCGPIWSANVGTAPGGAGEKRSKRTAGWCASRSPN